MARVSPKMCTVDFVDLPKRLVEKCSALSMDIGGSVLKVVYKPKDNSLRHGEPELADGMERFHLVSYSKTELVEALQEIKDRADIPGDRSIISTTGVGSNEHRESIENTLRVKIDNLSEFSCFVEAFCSMSQSLTKDEIISPPHAEGTKEGKKILKSVLLALEQYSKFAEQDPFGAVDSTDVESDVPENQSKLEPLDKTARNLFPCILFMLGSGFCAIKITADGKYNIVEPCPIGGKSFLAFGNLLTGAKTYEELISLAEDGDDEYINFLGKDLKTTSGDAYSTIADEFFLFSFGKATNGDLASYRKADLARALVVHYAYHVMQTAHTNGALHKARHVFFCGSFGNADLIRRETCKFVQYRSLMKISQIGHEYHWLKHGSYLGAIGALLKSHSSNGREN